MEKNKIRYKEFCRKEPKLPIFSQYWWLDAVCGADNWDVVVIENGGVIVATMPIYFSKNGYINMPLLSQKLGHYLKYPMNQKYNTKLSYEKAFINKLIDELPVFKYYYQHFDYLTTNWLPYFWRGFKQTTRYTYVIDKIENINNVYSNFTRAKRKQIERAEKIVKIKYDISAEDFYKNHVYTLRQKHSKILYDLQLFKKIYNATYKRNQGKTLYAIDDDNNIHAALFIVWDSNSGYDLISTIDNNFKNSGASSLIVYEAIKFLGDKTKKFDFEGSMIESVEASFRDFGAKQHRYFAIFKDNRSTIDKIRNKIF